MHPGYSADKGCLSSEIRHLILNTATYEKPGANYASVRALKGYKESFVFEIITRENSTLVKYASHRLCYALTLVLPAGRKEKQKGVILFAQCSQSFFFFPMRKQSQYHFPWY